MYHPDEAVRDFTNKHAGEHAHQEREMTACARMENETEHPKVINPLSQCMSYIRSTNSITSSCH